MPRAKLLEALNQMVSDPRPTKRSLTLNGHRTSVSLEPEFWEALKKLAASQDLSVNAYAAQIDAERAQTDPTVSLASVLRVRILRAVQKGQL
ncbi:MAG: ribbon-helix-helix domain-containing protein [Pseudomonadota bacterium]